MVWWKGDILSVSLFTVRKGPAGLVWCPLPLERNKAPRPSALFWCCLLLEGREGKVRFENKTNALFAEISSPP